MRTLRTAAAGLVLACAIAAPAHAQPRPGAFPTLRPGQSVSGRIATTDPAMYQRGRFKVYQFQASPGRRYIATLQSDDFDAYLTVARTVGGITDHMLTDDDGTGEGTGSRLRFTVPAAGTYLLLAQSLDEDGTGAFTLRLDSATIRQPRPQPLTIGTPVTGSLTESDAEYEDQGGEGFYDLYRFQGRAGQRVRIRMEMGENYPSIEIGTREGGTFTPLETVTPGPSQLTATLPAVGEYFIRVGVFGSVTGEYTLTTEERAAQAPVRTTPIRRGESATGQLEEGDAELDDGRWYDAYGYTGRAGERVRIDLRSEDFDAYVSIGRMVDGNFAEIASNDDAEDGEGLDSSLELELPEDGRYVIQATSFSAGGEGSYEVSVSTP
ncbi:MAG TPA: PPC domain-containing protein [Longimicrobium sp.]|nr:PPC domain-containing protein [Longimicrobium sp.]